jgi:hypothetical protein
MAVSDGKGAGGALIEATASTRTLIVAGVIALPGIIATLALTIWAITST